MKQCSCCKEVKPFTEFYRRNTNRDGYHSQCKQCRQEYVLNYSKTSDVYKKNRLNFKKSEKGKELRDRYFKSPSGVASRKRHMKTDQYKKKRATYRNNRRTAGEFDADDFKVKITLFKKRCAYCGRVRVLEVDHVHPIDKGGTNISNNIVPACRACNARKHALTLEEYIEKYGVPVLYSKMKEVIKC